LSGNTTAFPLVGRVCRADYGESVFEHDYQVPGKLTLMGVGGPFQGYTATVEYSVVPLREDIFAVSFLDGPYAVIAVADLGRRTITTFLAGAGEAPTAMRGTLTYD
jgi:hypothetical protein